MKIHEYQARALFQEYQMPVPPSSLCSAVEEVENAAEEYGLPVVIKAQVHAGGRGKAGGVKLAFKPEDVSAVANKILGMDIKGYTVENVLVTPAKDIEREFYLGFINNRNSKNITLMVSAEGGVDIEEVAKNSPEKIIKLDIDPIIGIFPFQIRDIGYSIFDDSKLVNRFVDIVSKLYNLYVDKDASLAEVNPLIQTPDGELYAIDGKMNFDENALYRQADIEKMREPDEDEIVELDAKDKGLSFVRLSGEIACMVNGAGLAMTTMDVIKHFGGSPANFLDIGGSSNPKKVVDAMNIILSDKNVKALMINIFGGITRCDDVARGLIEALDTIDCHVPIVVRLSGTNYEEGLNILKEKGLETVSSMEEAAQRAIELANNN
ncbi:MAG: ADP-forming succinate--CoA ligase subunit beta [Bacteroidales bacterium]